MREKDSAAGNAWKGLGKGIGSTEPVAPRPRENTDGGSNVFHEQRTPKLPVLPDAVLVPHRVWGGGSAADTNPILTPGPDWEIEVTDAMTDTAQPVDGPKTLIVGEIIPPSA